jgi:hypothetical protein
MVKNFMKWCGVGSSSRVPEYLLHDSDLYAVVWLAWAGGFTVQSDNARSRAVHVAIAASLGLITTQVEHMWFGRTWYITADGIEFMQQYVYINPEKSEVDDDYYIAA